MGICMGSLNREPPVKQIATQQSLTSELSSEEDEYRGYIIHLMDSSNIPTKGVDLLEGIQAYIKIKIKSSEGLLKAGEFSEHKTSIRDGSDTPKWNSYRKVGALQNDVIHLELWDEDWVNDDYLGEATISINGDLKFNEIIELPFIFKDSKFDDLGSNIRLKIFKESDLNFKDKTIYLIRHGESEFNAALEKSDVVEMWSKTDHPLTSKGIEQCITLNERIKNADREDDDVKDFLSVDSIFSSPLSRAAQTAFISLSEHPVMKESGLILLANCREFKSIGGRDSTGNRLGADIKDRCLDKLKRHKDDEFIDQYKTISWDYNDCDSKWWSGIHDKSNKEVDERFDDFVNFVRYRPERNIIIVSHSVFIRYFFKRYLPKNEDDKTYDDVYDERYETAYCNDDVDDAEIVEKSDDNNLDFDTKLATWKLENGGCIKVDLKFNDSYRDGVMVNSKKLMFDSVLRERGKKDRKR
eukprot:CAMPEP_0201575342 /NCGR_PEP_ID=MMETSP0190_2-20130828/20475_1 /ASSEMBLY_ACC=CAM_ASM_000263 /TAXON_ID=37353 /ORGANISM="Rosalina sp." /LENGTH=468 /DNA_ID=CAMNT_0048004841 /DNA_START=91 /DNA_END=1497 /DNA_ORIENTATION=+